MKFQKAQTIINIENVDGDVNVKGLFNLPKQLVTIPFIDVNEVFGRTQNLVEVYKLLRKTSKVVLVNGIGGIGKTTIAKALLETYKKKFKHIIWVQVESDIKTDFVNNQELVFILDLVEEFNKLPFSAKKEEGFKLIISRLRTIDGPNLMIIDNVYEDIENIKTLDAISLKPNWKVLVTSREQLLGFDNYLLGELSNIDALDLFFYHYKVEGRNENNEKLLATVFNEIEYNTLLIELLAKTGQSRRLFIDEIAEIIKKKALIFLESIEIDSFIQFQRADNQRIKKVFTFLVGIFEISSLSNYEKVILSYFSVMSNKPLPFFAKDNREGLNTFFQSIDFSKRVRLSKAINNLSKKGWLIWDGKNDSFRMHQTIQEIIRYKIKPSVTDLSTLIKFLSDVLAESHLFKKIFAKSHSEIVYKNILIISPNDQTQILWANFVNNLGMINKEIGEYDKAEQFYNDTIIIKENLVSSNSFFKISLSETMHNFGSLYVNLMQFEKAEKLLDDALKIYNSKINQNINLSYLSMFYTNLGIVYRHLDLEKGKYYHKKCIRLRKKIASTGQEQDKKLYADSLTNFGVFCITSTDYLLAEKSFLKAYGIYNELENEENEETYIFLKSRVLLNLGELYKNTHEFEKANKSFKDCNNIRRKLNKKNSDIYSKPFGNSLYCYAELLHINNFIEDTIEIINEALDIYFKLYYKNPYSFYINIGQCLIKKAEVCSIVNQISEAKSLLAQAIEIVKNHKDIDECLDLIIQSESLLEELNNN